MNLAAFDRFFPACTRSLLRHTLCQVILYIGNKAIRIMLNQRARHRAKLGDQIVDLEQLIVEHQLTRLDLQYSSTLLIRFSR